MKRMGRMNQTTIQEKSTNSNPLEMLISKCTRKKLKFRKRKSSTTQDINSSVPPSLHQIKKKTIHKNTQKKRKRLQHLQIKINLHQPKCTKTSDPP